VARKKGLVVECLDVDDDPLGLGFGYDGRKYVLRMLQIRGSALEAIADQRGGSDNAHERPNRPGSLG
jgi:hypothetical protein